MTKFLMLTFTALVALTVAPNIAAADKLDDIIGSGKLRCGVTLDFPPMGARDSKNEPIGYDVDYCKDLAKALGVQPEVVETPFADRIPALTSERIDIAVASTSDTLERAKVVGFSNPYTVFKIVILTRSDAGIEKWDDIKGHVVGGTAGTFEGAALEKQVKAWNDPKGTFRLYQNQADLFLALSQGKIDAALAANTVAFSMIKSGQYNKFVVKGDAPLPDGTDYVSIIAKRQEQGLLNYINLFIYRQVRTGRYQELWKTWVGGEAPDLTVKGVYR